MRTLQFLFAILAAFAAGSAPSAGAESRFVVAPLAEQRDGSTPEVFVVVTEEQRFSFVAPRGWSVFHNDEERLITLRRGASTLSIKFGKTATDAANAADHFLAHLREIFSGAEVLDRPSLSALSRPAAGFDLKWIHAQEFPRMGRFARAPLPSGDIDFGLICPPDEFGAHLSTLMRLMNRMRSAPADEPVEIPVFQVE